MRLCWGIKTRRQRRKVPEWEGAFGARWEKSVVETCCYALYSNNWAVLTRRPYLPRRFEFSKDEETARPVQKTPEALV
jgi:hypothetical protein